MVVVVTEGRVLESLKTALTISDTVQVATVAVA